MDLGNYYTNVQQSLSERNVAKQQQQEEAEKDERKTQIGDIFGAGLTAVGTEEAVTTGKKAAKALGKKFLTKAGVKENDADDFVNGRARPLLRRNINRLFNRTAPQNDDLELSTYRRSVTRTTNYNDLVQDKDLYRAHVKGDAELNRIANDEGGDDVDGFIENSRQELLSRGENLSRDPITVTYEEPAIGADGLQPGYRVLADVEGRLNPTVARNIYGQPLDFTTQESIFKLGGAAPRDIGESRPPPAQAARVGEPDIKPASQVVSEEKAVAKTAEETAEKTGESIGEKTASKALIDAGEDVAELPDVGEIAAPLLLLAGGAASLFHKKSSEPAPINVVNPSTQFLGN